MNKMLKGLAPLLVLTFAMVSFAASAMEKENDSSSEKRELTSRDVFTKINPQALELLPVSIRLDMLDYWDVDSVYKASNVMRGLSWLENVTPDYLKVRVTSASLFEIKILPGKKGDIVLTVYTVGNSPQAEDSQINFYDADLNPLDASKHFDMPDLKDFFEIPKGSLTSMKEIRQMIPFPTVAYSVSPENNDLIARLTVEEFINADDWNIIKLFLKPTIKAEWKKEKYKF